MNRLVGVAGALALLLEYLPVPQAAASELVSDEPIYCQWCAGWNEPQEPFRIYGNTYYVGTAGLSAVLVASDDGHVLIDGALPQSAPLIAASIRELGYRLEDVRLIVNSHAHYDHAGGLAALQRASGADIAASSESAKALTAGKLMANDPQYGLGEAETAFPPVDVSRILEDGETITVGSMQLISHFTPGHTPGGTSWTWRSCEDGRCLDMVYADSLTAVSAPGFRFGESGAGVALRRSIETVRSLPCDVLLVTHPENLDLQGKYARMKSGIDVNPFVDPSACSNYAARALKGLEGRLAKEDGR